MAVVVCVENPEVTWDFADEVGRQLSCFNGAARIYWPRFSKTSDPKGHRLFLGASIEQTGPDIAARAIERAIFAVAAFRYVPDARIADLVRRAEAAERQKLLLEKRKTGDDFLVEYENDLARLDEAKKHIEDLEAEIFNLKANQQVFFTTGSEASEEADEVRKAEDENFNSVFEAAQAAAERCKNLEFLDTAMSAAAYSPYQRPYDVFKALTDLNEIVDAWVQNQQENGSGGDLLVHLRERGWGKRSSMHISNTTKGKNRANYEFNYQGKRQLFEPHITIGSGDANLCASIHFIFDHERPKIIIGYIGRHLPNTKT